jgi:hypothetical protein
MTELSRTARKITFVLFLAQSLASAGFIAAATVNSIVGATLGGNPWADVPSAVFLLGSLGSGLVFAASGYLVIALLSGALALLPLVMVLSWMRRRPIPASV